MIVETHFILIIGIFIQFEAATAANGTNLPTTFGILYKNNQILNLKMKKSIKIIMYLCQSVEA